MKLIKDYDLCFEQLGLHNAHEDVFARKSRVKRTLSRLKATLHTSGASRTRLKQYYKISIQKQMTRLRMGDLFVLPFMVNKVIKIYNGKYYVPLKLIPEYLGHYISEFISTRTRGPHSAKGQKPIKRT